MREAQGVKDMPADATTLLLLLSIPSRSQRAYLLLLQCGTHPVFGLFVVGVVDLRGGVEGRLHVGKQAARGLGLEINQHLQGREGMKPW